MRTIVINLDRATTRLAKVSDSLSAAGMGFERLPAVEGRSVPERLWAQFSACGHLLDGEVGCYASHILAWEMIAGGDAPWALVLEDDVHIPVDARSLVGEIVESAPEGWDLIKLSSWSKSGHLELSRLSFGSSIVAYPRIPALSGANLVSWSGAVKFMKPRARMAPQDVDLGRAWQFGAAVYGVEPPPILQKREDTFISDYKRRPKARSPTPVRTALSRAAYNFHLVGPLRWSQLALSGLRYRLFGSGHRRRLKAQRQRLEREIAG